MSLDRRSVHFLSIKTYVEEVDPTTISLSMPLQSKLQLFTHHVWKFGFCQGLLRLVGRAADNLARIVCQYQFIMISSILFNGSSWDGLTMPGSVKRNR